MACHDKGSTSHRVKIFVVAPVLEESHNFLGALLLGPVLEPVNEASLGEFFLVIVAVFGENIEFELILRDSVPDSLLEQMSKFFVVQ